MTKRVAVFVDGENISAAHAGEITKIAKRHGPIDVQRVYGNACLLERWSEVPGYRLMHSGSGKNAADMLLAIEALDLALTKGFTTVVIASSDRDFLHLANRLREGGVNVVGIGEAKTPEMFRAVCHEFELVGAKPPQEKPKAQAENLAGVSELDLKIRTIIAGGSTNGEGLRINLLGTMHAKHGIKISSLPERTWRKYLMARPNLYELDPQDPDAKVRFKAQAFGQA